MVPRQIHIPEKQNQEKKPQTTPEEKPQTTPVASDPMKKQNFRLKRQMAMLIIPTVTVIAPP